MGVALFMAYALLTACGRLGFEPFPQGLSTDSGPVSETDGGPSDASIGGDSDLGPDAGPPKDAGPSDAGTDADAPDGSVDSGTTDMGVDSGTTDMGVDSGTTDMGVDSGTTDMGVDSGTTGIDMGGLDTTWCSLFPGALFCSGLELSSFPEWYGQATSFDGMVSWSNDPVYRGSGAFRAQIGTAQASATNLGHLSTPVPSGPVYMRSYIYADSATPVTSAVAAMWMGPRSSPTDGLKFFITSNSVLTRLVSTASGSQSTITRSYNTPFPTDTWVCVELALNIGSSGSYSLFIEDTEVINTGTVSTLLAGDVSALMIGIRESATNETGADLSFDEVVVDDVPIGCD